MTPAQRRTICEVERRSKGWPVGITVPAGIGRRLVAHGYAEWAPPLHYLLTTNRKVAIRATTKGKLAAGLPA